MKAAIALIIILLTVDLVATQTVHYETVDRVIIVEVAAVQPIEATPYADSLVDWDELDRQTDCLWQLLQTSGVEITLETVLAAGVWTDALGGACKVIGEDDE
jgi:hypothetical protein